jgi:protein phosphatase
LNNLPDSIAAQPRLRDANQRKAPALWDGPFIDIAGDTHRGRVRSRNEDAFLTSDLRRHLVFGQSSSAVGDGMPYAGGVQSKLLAVADGMGGAPGGHLASWVAVETLCRYVAEAMPWFGDLDDRAEIQLVESLERAFATCQDQVVAAAADNGLADEPVGTTLTAVYLAWPIAFLAHVGDSRAYLFRNQRLRRLTTDDTVARRLVDRDLVGPDRVEQLPGRLSDILTNSIGGGDDALDIHVSRHELEPLDQLLLCTDGLTRHLSDFQIARVMSEAATAESLCRRLIEAALAEGGEDNISVVVARASAGAS